LTSSSGNAIGYVWKEALATLKGGEKLAGAGVGVAGKEVLMHARSG
jgi:hypothetical protein